MRREKKYTNLRLESSSIVIYETKGGITIPGRSPCSLQPPRWVGDSRSLRSTASHTFTQLSTHAPRRSWACFICKQRCSFARLFIFLFSLPLSFFYVLYTKKREFQELMNFCISPINLFLFFVEGENSN